MKNQGGDRCPNDVNAPVYFEEAQAHVLLARAPLRIVPMGGLAGFDWPALLALADGMGMEPEVTMELMAAAEIGMMEAVAEKRDQEQ